MKSCHVVSHHHLVRVEERSVFSIVDIIILVLVVVVRHILVVIKGVYLSEAVVSKSYSELSISIATN